MAKTKPETATEVAQATFGEVKDAAYDQYDALVRAMRRDPFTAVAIAAGVGFALALLARK